MDLQVLCIYLISFVSTCLVRAWPYSDRLNFPNDPAEQTPHCRDDNKPCKILVREYHSNGTVRQDYGSGAFCECRGGATCPSEWDQNPDKTITRYLRTLVGEKSLQMKFCQPIQALRACRSHEVALSLKGRGALPTEVSSVRCRCPSEEPLILQKVWVERTMERHENFVCSMPACGATRNGGGAACQLNVLRRGSPMETTLLCECPGDSVCRMPLPFHGRPMAEFTRGFCQPVRG